MKRFYKNVTVQKRGTGFVVVLDDRPLNTPNKQLCTVPTESLAQSICAEWQAVPIDGQVVLRDMPMTGLAFTAIDTVLPHIDHIRKSLIAYADTDVICYRSATFQHLRQKQQQAWDTWVTYAHTVLSMPLVTTAGVMPMAQPPLVAQSATNIVAAMPAYPLTAFADMVAILGSLVMAVAVIRNDADGDTAFQVCYLDERHQIAEWGSDAAAADDLTRKQQTLKQAVQFYKACVCAD